MNVPTSKGTRALFLFHHRPKDKRALVSGSSVRSNRSRVRRGRTAGPENTLSKGAANCDPVFDVTAKDGSRIAQLRLPDRRSNFGRTSTHVVSCLPSRPRFTVKAIARFSFWNSNRTCGFTSLQLRSTGAPACRFSNPLSYSIYWPSARAIRNLGGRRHIRTERVGHRRGRLLSQSQTSTRNRCSQAGHLARHKPSRIRAIFTGSTWMKSKSRGPRIHSGDKRRPGDRALRWHGGLQRPEIALGDQGFEVGIPPFLDNFCRSVGSIPSIPSTTTFLPVAESFEIVQIAEGQRSAPAKASEADWPQPGAGSPRVRASAFYLGSYGWFKAHIG